MTNDAKEWVTVKLPKEIRNDARGDSRTYGEVMRAGLKALEKGLVSVNSDGTVAMTKRDADDAAVDAEELTDAFGIPDEVIPDDLDDRLDRIESATKEATNAAQSADRKLENMGGR